jgi:hypothetical protein
VGPTVLASVFMVLAIRPASVRRRRRSADQGRRGRAANTFSSTVLSMSSFWTWAVPRTGPWGPSTFALADRMVS